MAKSENEAEFLAALRASTAGRQPGSAPMKLNTPPARSAKSVDEMLEAEAATQRAEDQDSSASSKLLVSEAPGRNKGFFVPMEALVSHRWNARIHRSTERIRDIASSMAATRQMHPISVTKAPDQPEKFYVVDGETRWKAGLQLKWKDIWAVEVEVDPGDPAAFYIESFRQTDATSAISSVDRGLRWNELIDGGMATPETIAQALEVSKSTVSKMLAYSKFPSRVVEFMHDNAERFPYTVASLLVPLAADGDYLEDDLLSVCRTIVEEDFSRRSVEALIKQRTGGSKRQPRRSALITRTIKKANQPIGSFKTFENGSIEFKLSGSAVDEHAADQLIQILNIAAEIIGSGVTDVRAAVLAKLTSVDGGNNG